MDQQRGEKTEHRVKPVTFHTEGCYLLCLAEEMQRLRLLSRSKITGRVSKEKKDKTFTGYKITYGEPKSELKPRRRKFLQIQIGEKMANCRIPQKSCATEKNYYRCAGMLTRFKITISNKKVLESPSLVF